MEGQLAFIKDLFLRCHYGQNKITSLRNDGGNKTRLHLFSALHVAGKFLVSVHLRQC